MSCEQIKEDLFMSIFPTIKKSITHGEINGFCDPRFERVAEEFERNFQQHGEVGASVCITLEGETDGCSDLAVLDRKSTRLNSSHVEISYAVFCLKKKKKEINMVLKIYLMI